MPEWTDIRIFIGFQDSISGLTEKSILTSLIHRIQTVVKLTSYHNLENTDTNHTHYVMFISTAACELFFRFQNACILQLTVELREVVHQMRVADFLFKEILLVKEEYNRWALEPRIGDDCSEQRFWFFHSILHKQKLFVHWKGDLNWSASKTKITDTSAARPTYSAELEKVALDDSVECCTRR